MQEDFIASLTYEVREEVIERYFHQRRVIELQIDYVGELARQARNLEKALHHCFARIHGLLIDDSYIIQFAEITGNRKPFPAKPEDPVAAKHTLSLGARIGSVTCRRKFRKLIFTGYEELEEAAQEYGSACDDLRDECDAVCHNMQAFEKNHDVMVIISFLKSMDSELLLKKHFLGDNFTPEEMLSVEQGMAFKKPRFEQFQITDPPKIPPIDTVAKPLTALADNVYAAHTDKIKQMLRR